MSNDFLSTWVSQLTNPNEYYSGNTFLVAAIGYYTRDQNRQWLEKLNSEIFLLMQEVLDEEV